MTKDQSAAASERIIIFDTTMRDGEQSPGLLHEFGRKITHCRISR